MIKKGLFLYLIIFFCTISIYSKDKKETVAIVDFEGQLNVSAMEATAVTNFLRSAFVNSGFFKIIDRNNMEIILEEQGFQQMGCTTGECAVKIGKLLNVHKIIIGNLTKLGETYHIMANVVDVETGQITTSDRVQCKYQDELADTMDILAERLEKKYRGKKIAKYKKVKKPKHKPPKKERKEKKEFEPSVIDAYLSYKVFSPLNDDFKELVDSFNGYYLGADIGSMLGVGVDIWTAEVSDIADIEELVAGAVEVTLTYPYIFNQNFLIYGGGGGRFESIDVHTNTSDESEVSFGNNAILLSIGAKLRFPLDYKKGSSIGIEANYSLTMAAKYTNYNMLRIGVFYGWMPK